MIWSYVIPEHPSNDSPRLGDESVHHWDEHCIGARIEQDFADVHLTHSALKMCSPCKYCPAWPSLTHVHALVRHDRFGGQSFKRHAGLCMPLDLGLLGSPAS